MFLLDLEFTYNVKDAKDKELINRLVEDPEYLLHFNLLLLSKNHNFFCSMDAYMKEFARLTLSFQDQAIQGRLEKALNKEVAILKRED